MKLKGDLQSPFTGQETVFKEYIPESADFFMLDISTGYCTMQNLFNRSIWEESNEKEKYEGYKESLIQDIPVRLRNHVREVEGQLWFLIQMGYGDGITLEPLIVTDQETNEEKVTWVVKSENETGEDSNFVSTSFEEAYDYFNKATDEIIQRKEEEEEEE